MANVQDVARFFIDYGEKSDEPMTNLRINKMLYFSQGMHLAKEGQPLFPNEIEAWPLGPVVADIYHKYKPFARKPIIDPEAGFYRDCFTESEYNSLLDAARIYGVFTTSFLVGISHKTGGAWDVTMKATEKVIPNNLIKKEFSEKDSPVPFSIPYDKIMFINTRDSNGMLVLSSEDDVDEWPEYDAV